VLRKRPDGYHEISSVMQAVSLCDTLRFEPARTTRLSRNMPGWSGEQSLVKKAVDAVRQATVRKDGLRVTVEKRIPLMSGLGGDSSDAAAVLRGLRKMWGLRLTAQEMTSLAAPLGSDVPFFLTSGTAWRRAGER